MAHTPRFRLLVATILAHGGAACDGTGRGMDVPVDEMLPDSCRALKVAAGYNHSCALTRDNRVLCWGTNDRLQHQFGAEHAQIPSSLRPLRVDVGGPATDIHTESGGSMCVLIGDTWSCWGRVAPYDGFGVLDIAQPTPMPFTRGARALEAGPVICIARQDGQIACLGKESSEYVLSDLGTDNVDVAVVFAGAVCGLNRTGTIICGNGQGRVGHHGGASPIVSADGGLPFMLGSDGTISGITDKDAQLATAPAGYMNIQGSGDRHTFCVTGPDKPPLCRQNPAWQNPAWMDEAAVAAAPGESLLEPLTLDLPIADLSVGYDHLCAVSAAGAVHCWGDNSGGQVGIDTGGKPVAEPVRVPLCPM